MKKLRILFGILLFFMVIACSQDNVGPREKFSEDDFIGVWEHGNYRDIAMEIEKGDTIWDVLGYYPTSNYEFEKDGEIYLPLFKLECNWAIEGEYLDISCTDKAKICNINKSRMVLLYTKSDEDFTYHKYDTLIKVD